MLNVTIKPHRRYLRAGQGGLQKLFVLIKLLPGPELKTSRPNVAMALILDTSGSMHHKFKGSGESKLSRAMTAARKVIDDPRMQPEDMITLIQFADNANVVIPLTTLVDRDRLRRAVDQVQKWGGGTMMAKGMKLALTELERAPANTVRKSILLTDGQTYDEQDCRRLAEDFRNQTNRAVTIGVGDEYNEDLLSFVSERSLGRPWHLDDLSKLDNLMEEEIGSSVKEVVNNIAAAVRTVQGVNIASLTRVYPSLSAVDITRQPYSLGVAEAGDYTNFVLELDVPERPPARARLAQIGLTYEMPGMGGTRGETAPADITVEFTTDEALAAQVDQEVMSYVQQRNVDNLVRQAAQVARTDPNKAAQTLQLARNMTQRAGNAAMTQALGRAMDELKRSGTIAPGTVKTIKLGARTQTMKFSGPDEAPEDRLTDEEIRRLTGA